MGFWKRLGLIVFGKPGEGNALPESEAHTGVSKAHSLASRAAAAENYPWRPPFTARLILHEGRARWFVRCNTGQRGGAMLVVIDDETQEVAPPPVAAQGSFQHTPSIILMRSPAMLRCRLAAMSHQSGPRNSSGPSAGSS